jgi:two-component system phosphate regulon sensor histidine kinase PhoR
VLLTVHDLTLVRHLDVTRRQFVSNVSHELRNPLAAMGALVETLEGGAISDPHAAPDFVRRLRMEVTHMNALVADLLTLSTLESGQKEAEEDRADVESILHESREVQIKRHGDRAAEVVVETSPSLVVAISPLRLRQIVDNLVDNSLRFTPQDGRITLNAREENGTVLIEVADTGEGIPPEHVPHIFERFYKADPSRHDPGTGLGLSIVKHIVETYKGSIEVQSEVGAGTVMSVRLPRAV